MLEFDEEVKKILGRPCFLCIRIAEILRKSGQTIEHKAEAEQAAVIYWMLTMYEKHGKEWRKVGDEYLNSILKQSTETKNEDKG